MNITTLINLLQQQGGAGNLPDLPQGAQPLPLGPLQPQGPTNFFSAPELPPDAPAEALDMRAIDATMGPRPTPPAPRSQLERVANALLGFSAGVQGRGGEFLEQLRQPQRDFEVATERYNARRAGAIESAEDRRMRNREQVQRRAEEVSRRDFELYVRKLDFMSDEAKEQTRQTFQLELEARRQRNEIAEQQRREREQKEREAKQIENQYWSVSKNRPLSIELGRYYAGLKESLSPAAVALDRRLASLGDVRMSRGMGGGGSGRASNAALRAVAAVESLKAELLGLERRPDGSPKAIRAVRQRIDRAVGRLSQFPGQAQGGLDSQGYPWGKVWNGQQFVGIVPDGSAQAQGKTITRAEMQALGVTDAQARAEGYTITP